MSEEIPDTSCVETESQPSWSFVELLRVMVICWMILLSVTTILEKSVFKDMDREFYGSRQMMDTVMVLGLFAIALITHSALFVQTYVIVKRRHNVPLNKIGWSWCPHWNWHLRAMFGGIAFAIVYYLYIIWILGGIPAGWRIIGFTESPVPIALPVHLVIVALGAITEEFFFRGFSYSLCRMRFGHHLGTIVSAGIFVMWHISNLYETIHYAIPLFATGLILAAIFERTRSLIPPIIFHGTLNIVNVILSYSLHD